MPPCIRFGFSFSFSLHFKLCHRLSFSYSHGRGVKGGFGFLRRGGGRRGRGGRGEVVFLRLALGELRGGGHGDEAHGNGAEIGDGEFDGVAEAHEHAVAGLETRLQEARAGAEDRRFQPGVAPAFGAGEAQHRERHLVGRFVGVPEDMRREVEGRGAGREGR